MYFKKEPKDRLLPVLFGFSVLDQTKNARKVFCGWGGAEKAAVATNS
jgi:hypothetical protein